MAQNLYQALSTCQDGTTSLRSQAGTTPLPPSGGGMVPEQGAAAAQQEAAAAPSPPGLAYVILSQALGLNVFNGTLQITSVGAGAVVQVGQGSVANELIMARLRSWALNGTQC